MENKKSIFLDAQNSVSYKQARVVIVPVPYERTTTYGRGTAKGPQAILRASRQLENYDIELDRNVSLECGIATLPSIKVAKDREKFYKALKRLVSRLYSDGKFPVFLGGEHSMTFPIVSETKRFYSDLSVLHLDAHSDMRDSYEEDFFSHACVMRRVFELDVPFVCVGIRSQNEKERRFIQHHKIPVFYAKDIYKDKNWMGQAIRQLRRNVYLTFDVDVFDPSIVPSTGTPEPGGLNWWQIVEFFAMLSDSKKRLVGLDLVELLPKKEYSAPDFICAKLIYKLIGLFVEVP